MRRHLRHWYARKPSGLIVVFLALLILSMVLFARTLLNNPGERGAIAGTVEQFGYVLKHVSLFSPTAGEDIRLYYGDYLSPVLLTKWSADPSLALGRLTSSPWPDRIEMTGMEKIGLFEYEVSGDVIETSSAGFIAARRPIELRVAKMKDRWLITDVVAGEYR